MKSKDRHTITIFQVVILLVLSLLYLFVNVNFTIMHLFLFSNSRVESAFIWAFPLEANAVFNVTFKA